MEEMQASQHLGQIFKRTLRIIARKEGKTVNEFDWQDSKHRDVLARELYHDARISVEECAPLMRELVQPSPGGLLALAWLCQLGQINPDVLLSFSCGLINGEPVPDALEEKDAVEVFERMTQGVQTGSWARCIISFYLLSTVYISAKGRKECLLRIMTLPAFKHDERRLIFAWAMGLPVEEDYTSNSEMAIPSVPPALARVAVTCMVDLGLAATEIVRHIITRINDDWEDKRYVLNGMLDLIDRDTPDLQASVRRQAFDVCLASDDPALRRRAYRIAARTESKDFLKRATKDSDASVRTWAISMLKTM